MASDFNFFRALRILALRDVILEPAEYHIRYVQRWYSKTFHVPLPEVDDLPHEHIFQAFYEERYHEMSDEERAEEKKLLLETGDQRRDRLRSEEAESVSKVQWEREVDALKAAELLENKRKSEKPIAPVLKSGPVAEPNMGTSRTAPKILPGIKMQFVDSDEFSRLLDGDGPEMDTEGNLPLRPPDKP